MIAVVATIVAGCLLLLLTWVSRRAHLRDQRVARDRAALRAAYAELEAAKSRAEARTAQLQATLAGMSDGVMMLDAELRLVQWNEHFASFTGLPREMLRVGLPMEEMLRAQSLAGEFGVVDAEAEVARRLAAMRATRIPGVQERQRPDGRAIELRRRMLPDGGFVTLYIDITARKQAEAARMEARRAAEAAIEQKAQFVAMVSHEIRVPLNAVISSLALLEQSRLSEEQRALSDTAREAGDTLLDLVNDILELSKMDSGRLELRPADFDLAPLLDGVREMFTAAAATRGVTLALQIAPDVPERLHADPGRLRQVVMNFVSNAGKFSRPGPVTIAAAMLPAGGTAAAPQPPLLRLSVRDQGPAITEAESAQLFQPFARLEYARTAGAPGTGLGLAICDRLARLMQGQIGVQTIVDAAGTAIGNEFWIALPLARHALNPPAALPELPPRPPRRSTVLLVEDVATNRVLTTALLRRQGHRVDVAESGSDAVRMVGAWPYDVVFMDLVMPGIDGYEAARRIRALPGPEGRVPIVALTASDPGTAHAACLEAGMTSILPKPVRPRELFDMLARIVWPMTSQPARPEDAPGHSGALIDSDRLADLQRGLPAGLFDTLVDECLLDMRGRMPRLHEALAAADAPLAHAMAHALAGMAGSYGMAAFERRLRAIMAATTAGDIAAARQHAQEMGIELDRSEEMIRALLRAQAA
jgi:signal transduction histidine kinase/FixJ family two-component response regulator/HPt (histidine-containing phosphotransfer) domain-containing protein